MAESTYIDAAGQARPDRRTRPQLRALFARACELAQPFFETDATWGGVSLDHLAYRVLRDNFPELSAEELHVVVIAVHRVHVNRRTPVAQTPESHT